MQVRQAGMVIRAGVRDYLVPGFKWQALLRENIKARFWAEVMLVGMLTYALRAVNVGRSFNIFIDEVTYLGISQTVANSLQVGLYGRPFYLHPPAFFFIEAAILKIFPPTGDTISTIYAIRLLNVVISAITGVLLFLIAKRAAGMLAGVVVAGLFGLNPFVLRLGSLNMLEASAIGFIFAGYWTLISAMREPHSESWSLIWVPKRVKSYFLKPSAPRKRHAPKGRASPAASALPDTPRTIESIAAWRVGLAGAFFGCALLVKESTAFLSLYPLLICAIVGWVIRRREAIAASFMALLVYSIYPLVVYLSGDWPKYVDQKFHGILRFLGVIRITGFNRTDGTAGPTLIETIMNRLGLYGTTYLLIAIGILAVVLLLTHRGRITRFVGVLTACAYGMMVYLIFQGTLEEQYFVYLVVPCLLAYGIAISSIRKSRIFARYQRKLFILFLCGSLLFTGWDSAQWVHTHTRPDNSYEQVLAYLRRNVPGGERVASTSEVGQYLLGGYLTGPWGLWHTVDPLLKYRPEYVLVTPDTVAWNYGPAGDELLAWIKDHGTLMYRVTGRLGNTMDLYQMDWSSGR